MRSPLERLKQLPWVALLQVAALTALAAIAGEYLLLWLAVYSPAVQQVIVLLGGPLGFITVMAVAMAVGAIAVVILEQFKRILINTGSLWALVGCLAIVLLLVQSFGLLPLGLVGISYSQLIGVILGVFLKGQAYWKSYRRR
ncbi:MAG: hypothetical protein NW220_05250 [Leptolyngbyaceae cyanobacterium bins.349]|nr:hypothetical protein [Leptolyngbyaceae cyanobacterium bins.349]